MNETSERAAVWFRVSSDSQDEANQVKDVAKHCDASGYTVVREFRLHDVSASKGEQEQALAEALADIRAGEYTVIVCAHSSRIDRRDPDVQQFYALSVRMAGGRIESAREPEFGKATLSGRLMTMLAQQANYDYAETLKGHIAAAKARIREAGAMDGRPPWGYTTTGDKYNRVMVPTELGRKYVPEIFARVIAGDSLATIAAWLTAEGVPASGVKSRETTGWWPRTLGAMVRCPTYKGLRCELDPKTHEYGRTLHTCPELVSPAIWARANKSLDNRPKRGPANTANRAMLAGVLSCGNPDCPMDDSPMYRLTTGYYRCTGKGGSRKGCGNMVRVDLVNAAVNAIVAETFNTPVMVRTIVPGNSDELDTRLEVVRTEIRQLTKAYTDGELSDDDYLTEQARLLAEKRAVESAERIADHVKLAPTGESYAAVYATLSESDRGPWLKAQGFRVTASKSLVTVSQGDVSASMSLG